MEWTTQPYDCRKYILLLLLFNKYVICLWIIILFLSLKHDIRWHLIYLMNNHSAWCFCCRCHEPCALGMWTYCHRNQLFIIDWCKGDIIWYCKCDVTHYPLTSGRLLGVDWMEYELRRKVQRFRYFDWGEEFIINAKGIPIKHMTHLACNRKNPGLFPRIDKDWMIYSRVGWMYIA